MIDAPGEVVAREGHGVSLGVGERIGIVGQVVADTVERVGT